MRRQSVVRPFAGVLAAASVWASVAHGQALPETPAAAQSEAAAVVAAAPVSMTSFELGMQALTAGQNQQAVDAFVAAYAADGNPAALLNLGIAYTNLAQLNLAVETLTRYTAHPAADAQQIAAVQAEIAKLRANNGVVVVKVVPENASIQIDGHAVTPQDGELIAAPGKRRFVVFADGFVSYDQTLAVEPGRFSLDVTLISVSVAQAQLAAANEAAAQQPATEYADVADEPEESAGPGCALENVCFGPVLSLLGPPNLLGGGLHFRVGEYFGAGLDYQMTPSITFDPISVSTSLFSVNARVYPFGGSFFLGGGFGVQSVTGQLSNSDVTVAANATFPAAMASIGFMGRGGFVMGLDLGVLFPLGGNSVEIGKMEVHRDINGMAIPQAEIDKARDEVQSQVTKVVDLLPVLVQLNLLRIGYLF